MANLIDLKGFTCHWRFVTRSQQLCSKPFLLPDIEISSFSLSTTIFQSASEYKRNNLAKERVANVSLGVVEVDVTYTKCPSLDITVIIIIIIIFFNYFFFGDQNSFMATILQLKVAKRRLFEKVSLERCLPINSVNNKMRESFKVNG